MTPNVTAAQRDLALDEHLGTTTPVLGALEDELYDTYSATWWGFSFLSSWDDEEQRAVASDLILSAIEGVTVNLRELALCDVDLQSLIGPNGRTMPGPDTTLEDVIASKRLHRTVTDLSRAFGSTLDCVAAVVIGILRLPASLQRASGAHLLSMPQLSSKAPASQASARDAVAAAIAEHAARPPSGWLEWALELRDAVVHRGHLTQVNLQRPSSGPPLTLATATPPQYLVRVEPHLRAKPWMPDMLTMSGPGAADELLWITEPAHHTSAELKRRLVALVEAVATPLAAAIGNQDEWPVPAEKWALSREIDRARTNAASAFRGFDPDYPVPALTQMRVHGRSAARLELAERLRRRIAEQAGDDAATS